MRKENSKFPCTIGNFNASQKKKKKTEIVYRNKTFTNTRKKWSNRLCDVIFSEIFIKSLLPIHIHTLKIGTSVLCHTLYALAHNQMGSCFIFLIRYMVNDSLMHLLLKFMYFLPWHKCFLSPNNLDNTY